MHVSFDENHKDIVQIDDEEDFINLNQSNETISEINQPNKGFNISKDHPIENVLGNIESVV